MPRTVTEALLGETKPPTIPLPDRLAVSPREAAQLLGVSVPTIYELLSAGRIPSTKVGARRLISTAALRALLDPNGGDSRGVA